LITLALASSSCVSAQKYDETNLAAKHYQNDVLDKQRAIDDLQAENARLRRQLDASALNVQAVSADVDSHLNSLKDRIAELGDHPDEITKFRVDGGYVYQVKESILFAQGSAESSAEGQQKLLKIVVPDINGKAHGTIYVRGHTDSMPVKKPETVAKFPHGNLQLSAARAVEVAALLTEKGSVDRDRVVVMGFGPSDPIAPNSNAENRQKNRRVEIFVSDETEASKKKAKDAKATGPDAADDKK
jgi:chemotaxis protein MotB